MSVRVISWVFEHSTVERPTDRLVLLVLADHARDDGSGAYPTVETLARKAGLSRRGAFLALERLKAGGHIAPEGRVSRATKGGPQQVISYRVLIDAKGVHDVHHPGQKGDARRDTKGVHDATPKGVHSSCTHNRPIEEPSLEPSSRARVREEPVENRDGQTAWVPLGEVLAKYRAGQRRAKADD